MPRRNESPSERGIPANLRALVAQGQRVRFNGFWLNESDRDRTVADWLDRTPDAAVTIKELVYRYITGATVAPAADYDAPQPGDHLGASASALLNLED